MYMYSLLFVVVSFQHRGSISSNIYHGFNAKVMRDVMKEVAQFFIKLAQKLYCAIT